MPSSRAGLVKTLSPQTNRPSSLLKMLAALLLFSGLSAVMVQAAPVPLLPPTSAIASSGCVLAFGVDGSCSAAAHHAHDGPYTAAHSIAKPDTGHPAVLERRALTHPLEVAKREEVEMVVLYRRKSIAAKIRAAFHHVGHAIKHAFQKVGQGIKHAAQKVGHFIKTTGAKIAKVGLKIVATAQKIASKVVGWLPGIGKPLGKAMEGESEGLNKASDAIHVKIGGKLGQAMHRMDKAQKVVGYIPRSVIPDDPGFLERDLDDYLIERDLGLWTGWEAINKRSLDDEDVYMF